MKKHLYGLDLIRVFAAVTVLFFHIHLHFGYSFGALTKFFSQGAIFMVCFFALSGFTLQYRYRDVNLTSWKECRAFYAKRLLSVFPMYALVTILYMVQNLPEIKSMIVMFPFEFTLTQMWMQESYGYGGNSLTWFLSCMMLCYFLFPLLSAIVKGMSKRERLFFAGICYVLAVAGPITVHVMEYNWVYSSPLFRMLEFLMGIITQELYLEFEKTIASKKLNHNKIKIGGGVWDFSLCFDRRGYCYADFGNRYICQLHLFHIAGLFAYDYDVVYVS